MRTSQAPASLRVRRRGYLGVQNLLTHPLPQPTRHSSSATVLTGRDVMEVRHLLVEEGIADIAGRVFGRQNDNALSLNKSGVEAGARGPGGQVG